MDLSIALSGIQSADASFDSAARALVQAVNGTPSTSASPAPARQGDSADLSTDVVSLLHSQLSFSANIATEIGESSLNQSTFSILG